MKNFVFLSYVGVLGAEPLGERVAEDLAMILSVLKRRCPIGDGHDRFRAKAGTTFGHLAFRP